MPDAPWMSSMLTQLLDAIESDPALLARIRQLLAAPVTALPVAVTDERPEVEWIDELAPADFGHHPPRATEAMTAIPRLAEPAATPAHAVKAALPVVVPPPGIRNKAKSSIPSAAPRQAPEPPRRAPPTRALAAPAAAVGTSARPAPPKPARPKPVAVPAALRAPPPPPPPPAVLDLPTKIAPFVLDWLAESAPEPEPSTGPARHCLVDGLRRELGSTPPALTSRLPADLLQPAGIRPIRPAATALPQSALPADRPRPTPDAAAVVQPAVPIPPAVSVARPSERQQAAALLAGRTAVMIGGECRPEKREALRRELGLKELRWPSTRAHTSIEPLLTAISDPEVTLVLLLIKLSSHSYGDLAEPCKRRGIPLVRIPGGYGANQLAHQILEQAGERLAALPAT